MADRNAVLSHLWSNHQTLKVSFAILYDKVINVGDIFHNLIAALTVSEWVFFDSTVTCLNDVHLDGSPRFLPTQHH